MFSPFCGMKEQVGWPHRPPQKSTVVRARLCLGMIRIMSCKQRTEGSTALSMLFGFATPSLAAAQIYCVYQDPRLLKPDLQRDFTLSLKEAFGDSLLYCHVLRGQLGTCKCSCLPSACVQPRCFCKCRSRSFATKYVLAICAACPRKLTLAAASHALDQTAQKACSEQLAQGNLHKATCTEQLAQRDLHPV